MRMTKSLILAGLALLWAGNAIGAEKPAAEAKETLSTLLELWRRYELPFPPKDAPLVEFNSGHISGTCVGFLLRDVNEKDTKAVLLTGWERYELGPDDLGKHNIRELAPEKIPQAAPSLREHLYSNPLYGVAVQCLERGWEDAGLAMLAEAGEHDERRPSSTMTIRKGDDPQDAMIKYIWSHFQFEALHPTNDRKPVALRMRQLLNDGHDLWKGAGTRLCEALEAALQPGKGQPGTPLALVDQLVDSTWNGGRLSFNDGKEEDPYHKLKLLGFAAVPDLIDHLDDPRLTRSVTEGFNKLTTWPRRVGDQTSDLLEELADNEELGSGQKGGLVPREAAETWWREAQAMGEEAYLLKTVFPREGRDFISPTHLQIIEARYPARLPEIYRRLARDFPKAQTYAVIASLKQADLPREAKMAVFQEQLTHSDGLTRLSALYQLRDLDPAFYAKTLLEWMAAWPADAEGPYPKSWESGLSFLVSLTPDAEVWGRYIQTVKKSAIGLRMELVFNFCDFQRLRGPAQPRTLRLLLEFLDDPEWRVAEGPKYVGKFAAPDRKRLTMRDFAASLIVRGLELDASKWPQTSWNEARRNELRQLAEARLKQP